jgi:hypothetical protein
VPKGVIISINCGVIKERDMSLFEKICCNPDHPLYELLPPTRQRPLREREHDFILPKVKTESRIQTVVFK